MSTIKGVRSVNGTLPHTKICEIPSADFFFEMFFVIIKAAALVLFTCFLIYFACMCIFWFIEWLFGFNLHQFVKDKMTAFILKIQIEFNKNRKKK